MREKHLYQQMILILTFNISMMQRKVMFFRILIILSWRYIYSDIYNSSSVYPTSLFSLLHMNIRSIPIHMNEVEAYLSNLCHNFSIVALTETWFSDVSVEAYSLQGYTHECEYRKNRSGGRVSLFIRVVVVFIDTCGSRLTHESEHTYTSSGLMEGINMEKSSQGCYKAMQLSQ